MREFLDKLPTHKASLHITHNGHLNNYTTVAQEVEEDHYISAEDFVSPEELQKAIETNELWTMHWYPETPVGFCLRHASTLEALLNA